MSFRLAVLREGFKTSSQNFYNKNLRTIYIPEGLLETLPDLQKFAWAVVDAIQPDGITSLILKSPTLGTKNLGTVIRPQILKNDGEVSILVEGKEYKVKIGNLVFIPVSGNKTDFRFKSAAASLLGNEEINAEVTGGQMGLIVDARLR